MLLRFLDTRRKELFREKRGGKPKAAPGPYSHLAVTFRGEEKDSPRSS